MRKLTLTWNGILNAKKRVMLQAIMMGEEKEVEEFYGRLHNQLKGDYWTTAARNKSTRNKVNTLKAWEGMMKYFSLPQKNAVDIREKFQSEIRKAKRDKWFREDKIRSSQRYKPSKSDRIAIARGLTTPDKADSRLIVHGVNYKAWGNNILKSRDVVSSACVVFGKSDYSSYFHRLWVARNEHGRLVIMTSEAIIVGEGKK